MLVCAVDQTLVHLREGSYNLVLLYVRNSIVVDNPSVQLRIISTL